MNKKVFWLSIVAVVVSFAGGFLLANALNRKELDGLRGEVGRLKSSPPTTDSAQSDQTLSDEEIRRKIDEADKNPENAEFQKGLAMALYQYAVMKQETKWLSEVVKLLDRVHGKNPKDYNTILSLGNIHFDLARNPATRTDGVETREQTNKNFEKAREYFQKALEIKPNDNDAQTDVGLTYLFADPPDLDNAVSEFQKSLKMNPKDERALENMARTFIKQGNPKGAEGFLTRLKEVNPGNKSLPDLQAQIAQSDGNKQ